MTNDLASIEDLEDFPGAPFTPSQVDVAVDAVRNAAGWHIAPERTETVSLDVERHESWLRLPTRKLASVDEIRSTDDDEVVDENTYRVSRNLAQVKRTGCYYWPCGYEAVEVDMTHGYEETPLDVLAAVAMAANLAKRDPTVRSVSIDDFSVTRNTEQIRAALRAELGSTYVLEDSLYGIGIA